MALDRLFVLAAFLLVAGAARAEDVSQETPVVGDVVYKGLVGKALDALPMDPENRVALQKTNAVVSGTLTGRSLSVWAGLANPILLVGGLVWGLFSASKIQVANAAAKPRSIRAESPEPVEPAETGQAQVTLLAALPAEAGPVTGGE